MNEVLYTNIQSKTKINGIQSGFFYTYTRSLAGVSTLILRHVIVAGVLAIFINPDRRIKQVQIGNRETKQ